MSCADRGGFGGLSGHGRRQGPSAFVAGRLRGCRPAWLRGLTAAWLGVVALSAGAQETGSTAPAAGAAEAEVEEASAARKTRGIEEILITSQGREQRLQEAAISAAVFNDDYIDAIGAQNIADISQFTPNLEIRTVFAATNPTIFIRGVGLRDFNANSSSSVAVYNDDIYVNSPAAQLGQLFDVQSVEVLRGPQGALYGRNASAGVIK
ncbi:MAG: Plug domain-containing protein, partial [Myxococcales bacterium]|nr:Plug domain-containing protein [Myxococcales bacterium]